MDEDLCANTHAPLTPLELRTPHRGQQASRESVPCPALPPCPLRRQRRRSLRDWMDAFLSHFPGKGRWAALTHLAPGARI